MVRPAFRAFLYGKLAVHIFEAEEENIAAIHKMLLRPPIQNALLKFKAKFDKNK